MDIPIHPRTKALIFDCDGTLAHSMPIHWKAWHDTLAFFGTTCPQEFLDQFCGVPADQIIKAFNQKFGHNIDPEKFVKEKQKRAQAELLETQPIKPVVDIVLKYKNKMPMAVASGGSRHNVITTLKAIGLDKVFNVIITADDNVSPKPSPEIFLEAARRLGVEPKYCQVFEDGEAGIIGARHAGMVVTDVRPFLCE